MASVAITRRETKSGSRFVVRYRVGGRAWPITHAGSFKTMGETRARESFVAGELAAGRNPADALGALSAAPTAILPLSVWADRFIASRIDADANTIKGYASGLRMVKESFYARDPASITVAEVVEWVASLAETRKPGTVGQYLIAFRLPLDHVGLDPASPVIRACGCRKTFARSRIHPRPRTWRRFSPRSAPGGGSCSL